MDGIIVSPQGKRVYLSWCCGKIERNSSYEKDRHTGTLTRTQRGFLPVALGKATKLVDLITDKRENLRGGYASWSSDRYTGYDRGYSVTDGTDFCD